MHKEFIYVIYFNCYICGGLWAFQCLSPSAITGAHQNHVVKS